MGGLLPLAANPFPRFVFVDCEATGLDRPSHPVEVGLAWCDGSSAAHLVRPAPEWEAWTWSPAASRIHGISRDDAAASGKPAVWVADWLNSECSGRIVCSDNPPAEAYWLGELFRAAGRIPAFAIDDSYMLIQAALAGTPGGMGGFDGLRRRVQETHPITHRAADDALFWAAAFREAALMAGLTARSSTPA